MSRQGFQLSDLKAAIRVDKASRNFVATGIASHFANVEDVLDNSFAISQIKRV